MTDGRVVTFPADRSLGRWYLHGSNELPPNGDAVGDVAVPPGGSLELEIIGAADLSPLERLRPDDLHALNIESRDFTDASAIHLRGLTCLAELGLADAGIGDVGVEFLVRRLPHLRALDVARTRVTDIAMEAIGHHRPLESLNLWGTAVTDLGLERLRGLAHLRKLVLHGTRVTGSGMVHVGRLRSLEVLDLWGVPVTDRDVGPLRKLRGLRELNLWRTFVTARGLAKLQALPDLESLVLCGPAVTDAAMAKLSGFAALRSLEIHGLTDVGDGVPVPSVTDSGLQQLATVPGLRAVGIIGTRVTEAGVARLRQALPACAVELHPRPDIRWFYRT